MISFQRSSYTVQEPESETNITGVVFLEKENGRLSEQIIQLDLEISIVTPNATIRLATISSIDAVGNIIDNDFILLPRVPNETVIEIPFPPQAQTLEFNFILFPDDMAEGIEAFQVTLKEPLGYEYTVGLIPETFVIITDNDCKSDP